MARNLLISGGAGFIGSHLVDRLLSRSGVERVTVVDDLSSGRLGNLAHITDARLHVIRADVARFAGDRRYDEIYHLASPVAPADYMARPVATIAANVGGAINLLGQLAAGGRFCFTSTSEIYGDPAVSPQREIDVGAGDPASPRASYVEAKRCTEALLLGARASSGVDVRVVRLFNTYGPRMGGGDRRAVPAFIAAALSGAPVPVHGDGRQSRSWGYIDDIADGLARYFWGDAHDHLGPMNLGNDSEVAVIDIARHVTALCPGATIVHGPAMPDDPRHRCPDLTLCRQLLPGWHAAVDYREGIARTIAWARGEALARLEAIDR